MSSDDCARLIMSAAAERKREALMSRQAKFGRWLALIAPRVVDWTVAKETGPEASPHHVVDVQQ